MSAATPIYHKRGDSFFQIGALPIGVLAPGFFVDWTPKVSLRTIDGSSRTIAELQAEWVNPAIANQVKILCINTDKWPLGPAVLDLKFVRNVDNFVFSSKNKKIIVGADHNV